MRVLGVARQHSGLVKLVTTILDSVHLNANLNSGFLQVCVGSDTHRLGRPDLAVLPYEILSVLLVLSHGLVDIRLHQLVLLVATHAFSAALPRVTDSFYSLILRGCPT